MELSLTWPALLCSTTLLLMTCPVRGQNVTPILPSAQFSVEGRSTTFSCEVNMDVSKPIQWWYIPSSGENLEGRQITTGNYERFTTTEVTTDMHNLTLSNTTASDQGVYNCSFGNGTSAGGYAWQLEVVPETWLPRCELTTDQNIVTITCTSAGHTNTTLIWSTPAGNINDVTTSTSLEMTVSVSHTNLITSSEIQYVCEAKIPGYENSESCSVSGPSASNNVIPYIIVALMSLIALLLFFVVLWILFRHRQCRLCREPMLEPHTVLDADALQSGAWIAPPVVAIDIDAEDEESVKDDPPGDAQFEISPASSTPTTTQAPDVVPTSAPVDAEEDGPKEEPPTTVPSEIVIDVTATSPAVAVEPAKSKTKNLTLNKNMDQNIQKKPTASHEKKAVAPFPVSRTRGTELKKEPKKKVTKHYKEPPVKARMKTPNEPIYAQIKKLNVPSKSVPTSSVVDSADASSPPSMPPRDEQDSSKDTSSTGAGGETESIDKTRKINDLGSGGSKNKRTRQYRKKSEDIKRSPRSEHAPLNIRAAKEESPEQRESSSKEQPPSKTKTPSDRIIYAELDFSKDVGLNILE